MYGQSRIFFVMARDGLLPQGLAAVSKSRGTPVLMTAITGAVVMVMAATLDLNRIVEFANAGTLCAFVAVAVCVLVLRVREPQAPTDRRKMALVLTASSAGTVFEWYDFFIYGSVAPIIAKHFFAAAGETQGYILTLLTFAAGFFARPFGAIVFGRLGDRTGR